MSFKPLTSYTLHGPNDKFSTKTRKPKYKYKTKHE